MSTLYEKITSLPPSLLPKVERFIDSLLLSGNSWNDLGCTDPNRKSLPAKDGKPEQRKAGFLKGAIVMHDNFFEPDDVWEEYM